MNCFSVCPSGALTVEGGFVRSKCIGCGACANVCPTETLEIDGKSVTVQEIVNRVTKDHHFYHYSGGGVTLSGGEPLVQYEFALSLAASLKALYCNLAIETSSYAPWDRAKTVLELCDTILFDIKHMCSDKHKQWTGVDNELILENAVKASKLNNHMIIRVPLVGGVNDDEDNISSLSRFSCDINVDEVHLLPFHNYGDPKYQKLGLKASEEFYTPSDETVQYMLSIIRAHGLKAVSYG